MASVPELLRLLDTFIQRVGDDDDINYQAAQDLGLGCPRKAEASQVQHVFRKTVKRHLSARKRPVDLGDIDLVRLKEELVSLLQDSLPRDELTYLTINDSTMYDEDGLRRQFKSPVDFVRQLDMFTSNVTITFIKKLLGSQFQIKWDTSDGFPEDFSYFDLLRCLPTPKKPVFFKNAIRSAQVKAQLFRRCYYDYKSAIENFRVAELCPPVYVHTGRNTWVMLCIDDLESSPTYLKSEENPFNWIDKRIRNYIEENAEIIPHGELKRLIEKATLYWVVVENSDLKCKVDSYSIGESQVYVGKANQGIKDRWLTHGDSSHCKKMHKCLKLLQEMTTYQPDLLSDVQLVEAELLLQILKGNPNCALFVMKTFGKEEVQISDETLKSLKKSEKENIKGKRITPDYRSNLNIIPAAEKIDPRWEPINIVYGMNCKY